MTTIMLPVEIVNGLLIILKASCLNCISTSHLNQKTNNPNFVEQYLEICTYVLYVHVKQKTNDPIFDEQCLEICTQT